MPGNPNRVYWDSCVFLSVLNREPDRHPILRTILGEVRNSRGSLRLVTSTFTLAEVAYIAQEKQRRSLDDQSLRMIDGLLGDETLVELVEATQFVMMRARDFIREAMANNHGFKPGDAVHLATALFADVGRFHTYNLSDFVPMKDISAINLEITNPTSLLSGPLI